MQQQTSTSPYRICTQCVMDSSDAGITFDADGCCNYCSGAIARLSRQLKAPAERSAALNDLVRKVKDNGKGKDYDCVIGVSGGVDSSMVAYHVKRLGLRAIAVHFDNGWNSETAVENIRRVLDSLQIDLLTKVVDWEEFRDLQLAFLRSSTANCEIPTDHAIFATLFQTASRFGLRYILTGSNLATESVYSFAGGGHYHQDLRHLKAIQRRFGTRPLHTYPTISLRQYAYYVLARGIRQVPFLNLVDYDRDAAVQVLQTELGWRDYGGKHCESIWTRFFQSHYLPEKFGCDKRRWHLSSRICTKQITREDALRALERPLYDPGLLRQDLEFVTKKFGLTAGQFDEIIKAAPVAATEYPSSAFLLHGLEPLKNLFRTIATQP